MESNDSLFLKYHEEKYIAYLNKVGLDYPPVKKTQLGCVWHLDVVWDAAAIV